MSYPIVKVEGIGPSYAEKLRPAGIATTAALLRACADRKGRKAVAEKTGIGEKLLLEWTNHADLMRVDGVGPQFAELLEAAGVDTVRELAQRNAGALAAKLSEVQKAKRIARVSPHAARVAGWIAQAQRLDPVVTH